MPVISRFYGIVVFMNYNDHHPPHFHARYHDQEVMIEIEHGIVTGKMSRRALKLIFEWVDEHQAELQEKLGASSSEKAAESDSAAPVRRSKMFLHVTSVRHIEGYRLRLEFNDGAAKEVDLSEAPR